jgi:hypothetical protein
VAGGRVAVVDRHLEVLEAAALEVGVAELGDEPRRVLAVGIHQPEARPRLVVVEDGPQPVRVVGGRRTGGTGEQLPA